MPPDEDQTQQSEDQSQQGAGQDKASGTDQGSGDEARQAGSEKTTDDPVRPEGLDDRYWDETEGVMLPDLLAKFNELEAFHAESEVKARGVPESPDGYELPTREVLGIAEDAEFELDADDPLFGLARTFAHENGLTQESFNALVGLKVKADELELETFNKAAAEEKEKLGDRADDRVRAVTKALEARIGREKTQSLFGMMYTAQQVEAFEALVRGIKAPTVPGGGEPGGGKGPDWDSLTADEKIHLSRQRARQKRDAA